MTPKTKAFDCVAMKHEAQRKLHEEYAARKGEFASYFDFLRAKGEQSPWQREFWAKVQRSRSS